MNNPVPVKVEKHILEKHVEQRLVAGVKKLKGTSYKWSSQNIVGVADRVVVLPGGEVWFIELKRDAGRLTPLQKKFQQNMAELRMGRCLVLKGIKEVDEWLWARDRRSFL